MNQAIQKAAKRLEPEVQTVPGEVTLRQGGSRSMVGPAEEARADALKKGPVLID